MQEGDKTDDDVGLFENALDDETPGQAVIQVNKDQDVDGGIHESVYSPRHGGV